MNIICPFQHAIASMLAGANLCRQRGGVAHLSAIYHQQAAIRPVRWFLLADRVSMNIERVATNRQKQDDSRGGR
jgi:hypothetical protein